MDGRAHSAILIGVQEEREVGQVDPSQAHQPRTANLDERERPGRLVALLLGARNRHLALVMSTIEGPMVAQGAVGDPHRLLSEECAQMMAKDEQTHLHHHRNQHQAAVDLPRFRLERYLLERRSISSECSFGCLAPRRISPML